MRNSWYIARARVVTCALLRDVPLYNLMANIQFAELVFGLVYAVGTDADPVVSVVENYLTQYKYATETFRVSDHLRSLDLGISFDNTSPFEKMKALMDAGNAARKQAESDSILAVMSINDIVERDQEEYAQHGQRTRGTFYLADVFVERKDERYKNQLHRFLELVFGHPFYTPSREEHGMFLAYASAARSAQLGRQVGAAIATAEGEVVAVGMNEVPCCRGGSYWEDDKDDSRDHKKPDVDSNVKYKDNIVNSVIKQLDGKLLTYGTLQGVVKKIIKALDPALGEKQTAEKSNTVMKALEEDTVRDIDVVTAVRNSELKDITEYGRAVHGEMDAILCCSRLGISVRGKRLFVTTFPCHNCTRHIVASGIRKVYYIEPYPKSKARDLHFDAICFDEQESERTGKIPFLPFVGIGPRRYLDLFSLELSSGRAVERKDDVGKPQVLPKDKRPPRVPMTPLSYLEREDKLLEEFKNTILKLQVKSHVKS